MASSALAEKFKDKSSSPKRFGDEGEPDMEESPRGGGAGTDDGSDGAEVDASSSGDSGGPPGQNDPAEDIADMLGVGVEDRPAFSAALQTYVQHQIAEALAGGPGGPEPDGDEGASPMVGSSGPGAGGEMGA